MQVIIRHREPADGDREDLRQFLQALLDPRLTVVLPLPQQERAPDAPCQAVVPASQSGIDEMSTCDCHHQCSPSDKCTDDPNVRKITMPLREVNPGDGRCL